MWRDGRRELHYEKRRVIKLTMNTGKEVRESNGKAKRKHIRYRANNIKKMSQDQDKKKTDDPSVSVQKSTGNSGILTVQVFYKTVIPILRKTML